MSALPLLAVGAGLYLLGPSKGGSNTKTTISNKPNVRTGPYGFRPGMTKGMAQIVFPPQTLNSNDWYTNDERYEWARTPDRIIPLDVIRDLFVSHGYINWRPGSVSSWLTKILQLYKYGYVFRTEREVVEHIMGMAMIHNMEKWPTRINAQTFSFKDYPIDYSNDDLGRDPAPSMVIK